MKFAIYDWMHNPIKPSLEFSSFDEAWDYILGELTDELSLNETDYQEYQVLERCRHSPDYL